MAVAVSQVAPTLASREIQALKGLRVLKALKRLVRKSLQKLTLWSFCNRALTNDCKCSTMYTYWAVRSCDHLSVHENDESLWWRGCQRMSSSSYLNWKINSFPLKIVIYIKPALLRNERLYWPEFEIFGIFGYVLRLARAETWTIPVSNMEKACRFLKRQPSSIVII